MSESKLKPYLEVFPKISVDTLLELFRDMRQNATCKSEQVKMRHEIEPCVDLLFEMVEYLKAGNADNVIDKFVLSVCTRVGVQFVGNAIVENEDNQMLLWTHAGKLKKLFSYEDTKLKNYLSMVYYNVMLSNTSVQEDMLSDDDFIFILLDEALLGLTEFPQFMIEKFLMLNYFDKLYYKESRRILHKVYLLELIVSLLNSEKGFVLDSKHVKRIAEDFKTQADSILNGLAKKQNGVGSESNKILEEDPRLAVKLLATLCSLSSHDAYNKLICDNTSLIINTMYTLRAFRMSEEAQKEAGCETVDNKPVIGFKGDLIRLLGNLCWKHKKNQDLVREHNCIPLILECCKLDENNPFICEWAVMAIRNLTESNQENQDFIASLKRTPETVSNVTAETDSNFTAETDSNVTVETDSNVMTETDSNVTVETDSNVTVETDSNVMAETHSNVAAETDSNVTVETDSNITAETVSNVTAETVSNVMAETVSNVTAETVSNVTEETDLNVKTETDSKVKAETDSKVKAETVSNVTTETVLKVTDETVSNITAETDSNVKTETDSKIKAETVLNVADKTVSNIMAENVSNVTTETDSNVKTETDSKIKAETSLKVADETVSNIMAENVSNVTTETDSNVKTETDSKIKAETGLKVADETVSNVTAETVSNVTAETDSNVTAGTVELEPAQQNQSLNNVFNFLKNLNVFNL